MALFNLLGKVGLDASGFYRGIDRMRAATAPTFAKIGKDYSKQILKYVGAGFVANSLKNVVLGGIEKAFDIRRESKLKKLTPEIYQTLSKLSERSGASVDDLAAKMSDGTTEGNAFADAVKRLNAELLANGKILDADQVGKMSNTRDKWQGLKDRLDPLVGKLIEGISNQVDISAGMLKFAAGSLTLNKGKAMAGWQDIMSVIGPRFDAMKSWWTGKPSQKAQTEAPKTTEEIASDLATAIAQANLEKEKKVEKEKKFTPPNLSSDFSQGRYFGVARVDNRPTHLLNRIDTTLRDINAKIGTFK